MTHVVLDTNVLISALIFPGGKPQAVVDLARDGKILAFTSPQLMEKFAHVLLQKFRYEPAIVEFFVRKVGAFCAVVHPTAQQEDLGKDRHVLECAIEANAHFLVTGDRKHLLPLREYQGIRIVTPAEFLVLSALD